LIIFVGQSRLPKKVSDDIVVGPAIRISLPRYNSSPSPLPVFLKEYRLGKSISLLKRKEINISEIAFKTGFNSQSYFSKCFQKKYNVSPTLYRLIINS